MKKDDKWQHALAQSIDYFNGDQMAALSEIEEASDKAHADDSQGIPQYASFSNMLFD